MAEAAILSVDIKPAQGIPGFMKNAELAWLATYAAHASIIVEVGSWQGRSTRALADHCPGVVYAVDPWSGDYYTNGGALHRIRTDVAEAFAQHLADHIARGRVRPRRGEFLALHAALVHELGRTVDLLFLDGDHREATVAAEIVAARALVRPGGILAGHDYSHRSWPGVRAAVDAAFGATVQRCQSIWWVTL